MQRLLQDAPTVEQLRSRILRYRNPEDLRPIVQAARRARVVLLGEASHGTSEFYTTRAELTKRLIAESDIRFIAVEGDWPSCFELNKYVKDLEDNEANSAREAMEAFNRWPSWMWANREVEEFAEWLRAYNLQRSTRERIGFYGLDLYSLWESMQQIIGYLQRTGSPLLEQALHAFACFEPYGEDSQSYGISAGLLGESCEEEVIRLLQEIRTSDRGSGGHQSHRGGEAELSAELNALVAADAEHYYRTMVRGGPESWNVRDRHMVHALKKLLDFHGSDAHAVIWEHNTHIGDARATDMAEDGMVNVGQLVREQYLKHDTFSVGFGTHHGEVLAGSAWGAPVEVMTVPPAMKGSWEDLLAQAGEGEDLLLLFTEEHSREAIPELVGHRAIGVVYDPRHERGNYVPSDIAARYDAFIYLHETHALHPLPLESLV
ncbi:erythromycin esterase family protein [Paenibacillus faecis]|uniref:Erythromycin esterase family protein n=1 Tax=Paenibacillus faecis TaxID=862114 RepID=A0A5D0CJC3_9BACL|nr:erythromycin esterase family protein [Paenibacillus faecis]TYA09921.1 erythromycin esterase family protein [Paenibacillus faecis]